jgi:hypothetical protein
MSKGFVSSLGDASIAIRILFLIGLLYIVIPLDSNPRVNSVSSFDAHTSTLKSLFLSQDRINLWFTIDILILV